MGRNPNCNPFQKVGSDRAMRYSGFFGVRETWVLLEISWRCEATRSSSDYVIPFFRNLGSVFLERGGEVVCFLWMVYVLPVGGSEHYIGNGQDHWCALETWFSTGMYFIR